MKLVTPLRNCLHSNVSVFYLYLSLKKMTGAIISQFYWKDANNQYNRYLIGGSFFFIEPDLGITTFSNLAMARSRNDMVYAEDYFYFDTTLPLFKSSVREGKGKQCIRLDREWLKEFPDKNITLIKFPFPVSSECFTNNGNSPNKGQLVICEGYGEADYISVQDDPESIDFIRVDDNQIRKFKLFRQMANIQSIEQEPIYSDTLSIDNLDVIYTDMHFNHSMSGGPILDSKGKEVLGVLSHEPDDPFSSDKFRGIKLNWF